MDALSKYREGAQLVLDRANTTPSFNGNGVAFVAGGLTYWTNAYVSCRLLRHIGCQLPIRWYYFDGELDPLQIKLVEDIEGTKTVKMESGATGDHTRDKGGWQAKAKAIMDCPFRNVLYMDADCFAVKDPSYMFETREFKSYGAILFPDIWYWTRDKHGEKWDCFFDRFEVPFKEGAQLEAGQMIFDKSKCWKALKLVEYYNDNSDITYQVVYGDKDTFYFGFERSQTPYFRIPHPVETRHGMLRHFDPDGNLLFTHFTGGKWAITGLPHVFREDCEHRDFMELCLKDLREQWAYPTGFLRQCPTVSMPIKG